VGVFYSGVGLFFDCGECYLLCVLFGKWLVLVCLCYIGNMCCCGIVMIIGDFFVVELGVVLVFIVVMVKIYVGWILVELGV